MGTRFSLVAHETFDRVRGGVGEQIYVDTITWVPEPGTALLVGLGLAALGLCRRAWPAARMTIERAAACRSFAISAAELRWARRGVR